MANAHRLFDADEGCTARIDRGELYDMSWLIFLNWFR